MRIPSGTRRQAAIKAAATRRKNKAAGQSRPQKGTSAAGATKKKPGNPEQTAESVESHDDSERTNAMGRFVSCLRHLLYAPPANHPKSDKWMQGWIAAAKTALVAIQSDSHGVTPGADELPFFKASPELAEIGIAPTPLRISKHPLFTVVVIHADGSETVAIPCAKPVAAAQYLSGYNSGHVACGEWAEAREIDLTSIRFTGRKLEHADVRGESKAYKLNRPRRREQAAAAEGGAV